MEEIGLFPLGLVLLPTEQVPLHIFEPRYRELITECLDEGEPFGLVFADDDGLRRVGTLASVVEVTDRFDDGRLNVVVEGGERFRLVEANTLDYEVAIDDPQVFTQVWTLSYRLRRQGAGGGGADRDPYAAESWEHACHEGNTNHIEGTQHLGFKWFTPVVPPHP